MDMKILVVSNGQKIKFTVEELKRIKAAITPEFEKNLMRFPGGDVTELQDNKKIYMIYINWVDYSTLWFKLNMKRNPAVWGG